MSNVPLHNGGRPAIGLTSRARPHGRAAFRVGEYTMSKCVFRTNLQLQPVSEPLSGVEVTEIFHRPEMPTVEECVHMLLSHDEVCLGGTDKRQIMQGARVVGYIRIVDLTFSC